MARGEFQFNGQIIELNPNEDNDYSASGESIKESHEELAQFADNDPK